MELAAWLGHAPSREALAVEAVEVATPAWLLALCDWDVEGLARAALAVGRAVATTSGGRTLDLAQRLRAAQALVDCPCTEHARSLLEAARRPATGAEPPVCDAVDQACLLAFRAHDARFTSELEPLVGLLLGSTSAAGLDDAAVREVVRREVVPWALGLARAAGAE